MLVSCTSFVNSGRARLLELRSGDVPVLLSLLLLLLLLCICVVWLGLRVVAWFRALLDEDLLSLVVLMAVLWWLYGFPGGCTVSNSGDVELFTACGFLPPAW